ncbi:MAG: hypothetical protein K2Z81_08800, partial [Cyanobacteria bacterium]|nr:hypothetical protein [Cyanobacteriota bacterium]
PDNQSSDVRIDMLLMIAEVYRICGQYPQCDFTLGQVSRELAKGMTLDSTVAIRYWRRKSDLLWSQNQILQSTKAYQQVVAAMKKDFPPESRHFMVAPVGFIRKLLQGKYFDIFFYFMRNLTNQIPDDRKQVFAQHYRPIFDSVRQTIGSDIDKGELERAKRLLIGLNDVDSTKAQLGRLWSLWLNACLNKKEVRLLGSVDTELNELIDYYGKERRLHQKVFCHIALDRFYLEKYQPDEQDKQLALLSETINQLGNDATSKERIALVESYSRPAVEEVANDPCSDKARQYLEKVVKVTPMPAKGISKEDFPYYCVQHGSSRIRLVRLLTKIGRAEEAEKVLATMDEAVFYYFKVGYLRMARKHLDLAHSFIDRKELAKAEFHMKEAQVSITEDLKYDKVLRSQGKIMFASKKEDIERKSVIQDIKDGWQLLLKAQGRSGNADVGGVK